MSWFSRKAKPADEAPAPPPRRSLWRRLGVGQPPGHAADSAEVPAAPAARSVASRLIAGLAAVGRAIDGAISLLAVPFGVRVRRPTSRFAILLGVFAFLFLIGALPIPYLPLVALAVGFVGVLAISRAWAANEHRRIAIVKKLEDTDPDSLPDLPWTAFVSALMLFVLFPLAFMQLHRHFGLFAASPSVNFLDWLWFSLDKTYLKALPDWSILYGVHISSIDFDNHWGRHLVMLSRLTFDYVLLHGVFRLLAVRRTIREAVAVVKTDPDVAVRVGRRAIPALLDKLSDPDRAVRGAAANAITQLGDPEGIRLMHEALAAA
jgi:hypothetical protein